MLTRRSHWSRRKVLKSVFLAAGLARFATARAKAPTPPNAEALHSKLETLVRSVQAETHAGRATGISVSVAQGGTILWERGFGFTHRESGKLATAHTPFSLASITKTFTAAAVMRLVEAGKLELEAPINRYLRIPLPRSSFDTQAVTLKLLGAHAGGLPSLFEMFGQAPAPALGDLIRNYGELAYPAGERYEYANLGYSLLGEAISGVTGREFSVSLEDLIIHPMGLRDSFFDTDAPRMSAVAGRYDKNNHEIPFYTTATPPSGELYASAHDLSLFAAHLMETGPSAENPLLGRRSLDALFSPVFTAASGAFTTFGWSGRDLNGERIIVKTGGQPGVAARLTLLPSRQISIAVIANRDDNRELVLHISSEIAAALIPGWINPDFQMNDPHASQGQAHDLDGSWTGEIRNGEKSRPVRLLITTGASTCAIGNGSSRPIRELKSHSDTLTFTVEGDLSQVPSADGATRQLEFKVAARDGSLVGRCLSVFDRPGFASTKPHIVVLSRST